VVLGNNVEIIGLMLASPQSRSGFSLVRLVAISHGPSDSKIPYGKPFISPRPQYRSEQLSEFVSKLVDENLCLLRFSHNLANVPPKKPRQVSLKEVTYLDNVNLVK